ncbi:MAG: hypothetical protein ACM3JI_04715, partial [Anaerolineae bacterium]
MRLILTLITLSLAGYGIWWIGTTHPEIKTKIEDLIESGNFHTLEVRYTSDQIMQMHRRELLNDAKHRFLDPVLKFYPYVLMEVKYNLSDDRTKEGVILWDLIDGEMVMDTTDWEKTHGYGDCINAGTDRHEFKILNILARRGGSIDREGLSKSLLVENDILDAWIDSCRKKKL